MPKEVRAYKCKWCDMVTLDAGQAEQAEKTCPHNPELECCANCTNLQIATTPRFENYSYPVKVCADPPGDDLIFNPPHDLGWCPNWVRNPLMEIKA